MSGKARAMSTRRSSLTRKPLRKKAAARKHGTQVLLASGVEAPIRYTHPQAFGAIVAKYAGIVRSGIGNLSTREGFDD
jgi:hypothetical protein